MSVYGMPIISNANNPYAADVAPEYCECNAELLSEVEIETGICDTCQEELDAEVADRDVSIDHLETLRRWIITDNSTGNIVKGYTSEADAMFDLAAIRNGERTQHQVKHNDINVGDRVACKGMANWKGTCVKANCGVIHAKMDHRAHESTTMFSAASSWVKIENE